MSKEKMKHNKVPDEKAKVAESIDEVLESAANAAKEEDGSKSEEFAGLTSESENAAKEIAELKQLVAEGNDRYIRLMAEFDNYKKRTSREYERQVECANEKLMVEMIEVRENFERALKSGDTSTDYIALFEGMKLIFNKFDTVLTKNGLESFAATGDLFDPQLHEALMNMPNADIPAEHIADIYERGYKLKSKVVKHAKVIVSSGAPAEPEKTDSSESK